MEPTLNKAEDLVDESKAGYFAEILKNLPKSERPGQKLFRKSLFKHNGLDIYAARDEFGFPYIYIPLIDGNSIETKSLSKGISVSENYEAIEGNHPTRYLEFRCASLKADLVFGAICNSLCQTLVDNSQPTHKILSDVAMIVNEWRDLLSSLIPVEPSRNEIVGLFGELSVLYFATKKLGPNAMDAWFGSDRARHDFEFKDHSLEVKTSTSSSSDLVTINGFQQLETSAGLPLRLVRITLDEAQAALTISSLIEKLVTLGLSLQQLDTKLASFDENVATARPDWCSKHNFRISKVNIFEVDETFPRLRFTDLPNHVQQKITSVEYKINLAGVANQEVTGGNLDEIAANFDSLI